MKHSLYASLLYTLSVFLIIIMQGKHIISIMQVNKQRPVTKSHHLFQTALRHQSQDSTHSFEFPKARRALSHPLCGASLCYWVRPLFLRCLAAWFFNPQLHSWGIFWWTAGSISFSSYFYIFWHPKEQGFYDCVKITDKVLTQRGWR